MAEALRVGRPGAPVDLRIFAKPKTLKNRRMGVALAGGESAEDAVETAKAAAGSVRILLFRLQERSGDAHRDLHCTDHGPARFGLRRIRRSGSERAVHLGPQRANRMRCTSSAR